ncbi:hypothetical protein EC988_000519 [Linderina pennispora]|nr:hypothetical protein EC988_000519 [Linderina pennispora]
MQMHKNILYAANAVTRQNLDLDIPDTATAAGKKLPLVIFFLEAAHTKYVVANSTTDGPIYPDHASRFASQLVHLGYEDVALVVRDMGTHFGELENPGLWQAIVKHLLP